MTAPPSNQIILGDCLEVMKGWPEGCIDAMITDPPYQLDSTRKRWGKQGNNTMHFDRSPHHRTIRGFMGKKWDVMPSVEIWQECLRVLKPGAFAFVMCTPRQDSLARMIVSLEEAGFETGFSSIYWTYACLSQDTEVLTQDGWKNWGLLHNTNKYDTILVYDKDSQEYKWEVPFWWNYYQVKDTLYRIKSDYTDQLVSRNHRCLIEREGKLLFTTPEETENKGMENFLVPYLANMSILSNDFLGLASAYSKRGQVGNFLQHILSPKSKYPKIFIKKWQAQASNVRTSKGTATKSNAWFKKLGVERWGDLFQKARELYQHQIYSLSKGIFANGTQRRLCYGTSADNGATTWSPLNEEGDYSSYRPQSYQQPSFQFNSIQEQSASQEIRGKTKGYSTTVASIWPEYYEGIVFCPTVSTGAFVARRNGKIFITGNSGFPKAANLSIAADKRACLVDLTERLNRQPTKKEFETAWEGWREVVGEYSAAHQKGSINWQGEDRRDGKGSGYKETARITRPRSPEAKKLAGAYTMGLKPALEIVLVVQKPLNEKTYLDQMLANGHGGMWLDDCRIPTQDQITIHDAPAGTFAGGEAGRGSKKNYRPSEGRFPANLLVSDNVLDEGKIRKSGKNCVATKQANFVEHPLIQQGQEIITYGDSGGFSRFFSLDAWWNERIKELPPEVQKTFPFLIVPKAGKREKNKGCDIVYTLKSDTPQQVINEIRKYLTLV